MKKLLLIPALIAGTLASAEQKKYEISPMIGYNIAESNLDIKDNGYLVGGGEIQFNTPGSRISPEFSLLYSQGVDYDSGATTKIIRGAFNVVHTYDAISFAIPFAKVGAGIERMTVPYNSAENSFFVDTGAGLKVPVTENLALKLEAIYMAKLNRDHAGTFDSNLVTLVGLTFAFGSSEQKAAPKEEPKEEPTPVVEEVIVVVLDDDKDGVINANDKCLATIKDAKVDANGCELDDDKDGVVNSLDKCANTLAGTQVDANGCALDDDKDGVANSQDECSNTPAGIKVDEKGCNVDSDNDGILNVNDICPNTIAGEKVNSDGCPQTVPLNINFENNSDKIKPESQEQINNYAEFLKSHTNYSVKIVGYTDSRGSASYNQKLSEKRAKSVVKGLMNQGVSAKQLSSFGAGENNPVATNETAEGRAQNRRIEAVLTRD